MAERQYFSLRYAIPGYTFILLVVLINYVPLLEILTSHGFESAFGAFLAFLSLLSGSAIGFLSSQFWWWKFQRNVGIFGGKEFERAFRAFAEKYKPEKTSLAECNKDEKRQLLAAFDYVSHLEIKEKLLILAERRWDMYHILSSTYHTLWIASLVGLLCRIYYEYFLLKPHYEISYQKLVSILSNNVEPIALISTFAGVVFLIWILRKERKWMFTQIAALLSARIRSSKVRRHELRKAFPDLFPEEKS